MGLVVGVAFVAFGSVTLLVTAHPSVEGVVAGIFVILIGLAWLVLFGVWAPLTRRKR